jgi:hypothetical protein
MPDECSFLWDGSQEGWVVVQIPKRQRWQVINEKTFVSLIIEDEDEYKRVVKKMLSLGAVRKISDLYPHLQTDDQDAATVREAG